MIIRKEKPISFYRISSPVLKNTINLKEPYLH